MKILHLLVSAMVFATCSSTPQPINYGSDACSFCQMTIVDKQHASEVVTVKGRSYKYDAIECMLNAQRTWKAPEVGQYLVCDYMQPGQLIDATKALYLISEEIPSPMGEFLTAFSSDSIRKSVANGKGHYLNWKELRTKFQLN